MCDGPEATAFWDPAVIRQSLKETLFAPGSEHGSLIQHIKIWEDAVPAPPAGTPGETRKPRFILLAVQRDGRLRLHKSKRNSNGTFSIGKSWNLEDLHAVSVLDSQSFSVTFASRPARWDTEHPRDQQDFVVALVRCFRVYTGREVRTDGFDVVQEQPGAPPPYRRPGSSSNRVSASSSTGPKSPKLPSSPRMPPGAGSPRVRQGSQPSPQPPPPGLRGPRPPLEEANSRRWSGENRRSAEQRRSVEQLRRPTPDVEPRRSGEPSRRPTAESEPRRSAEPPRRIPSDVSLWPDMAREEPQPLRKRPSDMGLGGSTGELRKRPSDMGLAEPRRSAEPPRRPSDVGLGPPPSRPPPVTTPDLSPRRAPTPQGPRLAEPPHPVLTKQRSQDAPPRSPIPQPESAQPTPRDQRSFEAQQAARPSPSRPPAMAMEQSRSQSRLADVPSRSGTPVSQRPAIVAPAPAPPPARAPVLAPALNVPSRARTPLTSVRAVVEPIKRAPSPLVQVSTSPVEAKVETPKSARELTLAPPIQMPSASRPSSPAPSVVEAEDGATTLANVEEMLEGFEWRGATADRIEARLVGELQAHEAASIHAIVESDDRVAFIVKHLDESIAELDRLDQLISLYRTQLNVVNDDIDHIESQNKGLQVVTSNQRALLNELESLLNTINIPDADLRSLMQDSLETQPGIDRLEQAAASLYKAILSTKGDFAAAAELSSDFQRHSSQFAKRFLDYLSVSFRFQTEQVAGQIVRSVPKNGLEPHQSLEDNLGRYCGLMLFVKETEEQRYQQICGSYFTASAALYRQEISALLAHFKAQTRKATEDEQEAAFTAATAGGSLTRSVTLRRAAVLRSPPRKDGKGDSDQMQGSEAFKRALAQIGPHVHHEQEWVADLLQIRGQDSYFTFAEYMDLETVFRRQASTQLHSMIKGSRDIRASMDLIFGFLPQELNEMVDFCLQRDHLQVIGLLSALDECIGYADSVANDFLARTMQKLYQRLIGQMEKIAKEQISAIETTKLTVKKRKGVVPFIAIFPTFVERIEAQLVGSDKLPIRRNVDAMYDDIVKTMFECLQQMAKMGGGDSAEADKDQLNYHVVLIENMHHFTTTARDLRGSAAIRPFAKQARDLYDENLAQYTILVLRRPLGKHLDFFTALQSLLKTTPPNEVSLHSAFTKSAARRVTSSVDTRDLRKAVEALSKRVDKHFNDVSNPSVENAQVVSTVWRACQDEAIKLSGVWTGLLGRCYADQVGLAFSTDDVRIAFANVKPGQV